MIEAEWWDYDDAAELADAVAGDVGFIIESALDARGPGGAGPPGDHGCVAPGGRIHPGAARLEERLLDPLGEFREVVQGQGRLGADLLQRGTALADHGERVDPGTVGERKPDGEPRGGALVLPHFPRGPYGHRAVRRTTIRKIKKGCV